MQALHIRCDLFSRHVPGELEGGVTWQEHEAGLEDRITDPHGRVHRGAYRALPSRRVYIEKEETVGKRTEIPLYWSAPPMLSNSNGFG
jgi:hypothetical protein